MESCWGLRINYRRYYICVCLSEYFFDYSDIVISISLCSIVGCFALALRSPFRWRGRSLVIFVQQPVLLWVVQGIDHFGHEFILLGDLEHGAGILVPTTVVSRREYREELAASEALKAVHDALVGSQDKAAPIGIEEVLDAIWAELHYVSSAVGVADKVGLNAQVLITVSRIRPENINDELLFRSRNFMDNLQRSLNLLNLIKAKQGASDASVKADDPVIDHCG